MTAMAIEKPIIVASSNTLFCHEKQVVMSIRKITIEHMAIVDIDKQAHMQQFYLQN